MSVRTTTGTVRCGHCKGRHGTIAQVKLCARDHGLAAETQPQPQPEAVWVPKHKTWLDAEREHRNARATSLMEQAGRERAAELAAAAHTPAVAPAAKKLAAPAATLPEVEGGRYAVMVPGGYPATETLKFFKVDRPTEGKWKGWTFLAVQASDELFPIKNFQMKLEVLRLIAADPKAAMLRYGKEIGSCGHCGRTLTNEDSRARGIGPVCADKLGW